MNIEIGTNLAEAMRFVALVIGVAYAAAHIIVAGINANMSGTVRH